ncbi:hypothetical protein F511_26609 [Dorcoceras hygrometricum]|uniref:Uncharacterized protein n=1 Tax=Dorcoceras hygrometricum TaxID=472368 RepID=A0A2Z7C146_9LAMI|nr:hypothetical protein F511_26609 [Dorcoceras hygrometricum]
MGPVGTIFGDLFDIKKKQGEQDVRLLTMDEQIAAIRNEHLDFQSKIAADMLSLSTQVGDIVDFLRSGAAKKGEVGSSSRPTAVRAQTQTLPPTTGTFEERVAQARRNIIETGQVISIEEAAARAIEADRRESERLKAVVYLSCKSLVQGEQWTNSRGIQLALENTSRLVYQSQVCTIRRQSVISDSSEMASSLISNSHHIDFESVFGLDDAGMVQMFETLITTGLKELLGCPAVFYEAALTEFFANSSVREDGMVVSTIGGTAIEISQEMFAAAFELPTEGLIDLTDVPKNFVFHARSLFSDSKEQWAAMDSLETAVKRKMYILAKYKELLLRKIMESHRQFYTPGQPWTTTASQIFDLLSDAHSKSLDDLLAQQREHGLPLAQPCPSPIVDSSVDSGAVLARFYSIANSTCWVRPMILVNGVWTPLQGPDFWRSSCRLSLFLNKMKMPAPAIQDTFVPHVSFIEPVQYWEAAPWLIRTWQWTKVCKEIVQYSMFGGLRPVREDICQDITVYDLAVERIPADFLSMFAQGMACNNVVDSIVQRASGDLQEVDITGDEEVDLVSSDVSTVYRSPSPIFQKVDSVEHELLFALGPDIFPSVAQEERLYFVQSPESSPAISLHQESSSSSTDVSMHFDSMDIPVNAQADTQTSAPVYFTMFTDALEDLRSSTFQRIHDSNCEILSKVNAVELGVRGDLLKLQVMPRQSLENACRVLERQGTTQETQINDLKKGLMAPVGTIFQDLFDIKKKQREQDAKLIALDGQIAAIRSEQLDFQTKIAADILSLSTKVGDIADYIRGGDAKKGEIGSSSRPSTVRTQTFPPTTGTFAERAEQARRHFIESGQVISVEEAAERVIEADRRESDRLERERARERREKRLSRSSASKRRRGF